MEVSQPSRKSNHDVWCQPGGIKKASKTPSGYLALVADDVHTISGFWGTRVCRKGREHIVPSEEPLLPRQDMEEPPEVKIESESQPLRVDPQNSIDPRIGSGAVTHLPILPATEKLNS